ncbi:hypothetical protein GQ53DRAFT_828209 [Thozetella sp. PMI_491]|nr:hypothetical protein GQ53DRAFT_828209 [Thozetella sp. PMI_491]
MAFRLVLWLTFVTGILAVPFHDVAPGHIAFEVENGAAPTRGSNINCLVIPTRNSTGSIFSTTRTITTARSPTGLATNQGLVQSNASTKVTSGIGRRSAATFVATKRTSDTKPATSTGIKRISTSTKRTSDKTTGVKGTCSKCSSSKQTSTKRTVTSNERKKTTSTKPMAKSTSEHIPIRVVSSGAKRTTSAKPVKSKTTQRPSTSSKKTKAVPTSPTKRTTTRTTKVTSTSTRRSSTKATSSKSSSAKKSSIAITAGRKAGVTASSKINPPPASSSPLPESSAASATSAGPHCTPSCIVSVPSPCMYFKNNPKSGHDLYEAGDFHDYLVTCQIYYSGIAEATPCVNDDMLYGDMPLSTVYKCLDKLPSYVYCAYQASDVCADATPKPPSGEAVTDGGFEDDDWTKTWSTWSGWTQFTAFQATDVAHSGSQSLQLDYPNTDDNYTSIYQRVSVQPNQNYILSYWVYQSNNTADCYTSAGFSPDTVDTYGPALLNDEFFAGAVQDSIALIKQPVGQWLQFSNNFTTTTSYGSIQVFVQCNPNKDAPPISIYLDDISLTDQPSS